MQGVNELADTQICDDNGGDKKLTIERIRMIEESVQANVVGVNILINLK